MSRDPNGAWSPPSYQRELPSRPLLPEAQLHVRREGTFLVLSSTFVVAAATQPLLGVSSSLDLSPLFVRFPRVADLVSPLHPLPLGALAFPLTLLLLNLVVELYGQRRGAALVVLGLLLGLGALALVRLAELSEAAGSSAFASGLTFLGGYAIGHIVSLALFTALGKWTRGRHRCLRGAAAGLAGSLSGWAGLALVWTALRVQFGGASGGNALAEVAPVALVGGGYSAAAALLGLLPLVAVAAGLRIYLRVPPFGHEEDEAEPERVPEPAFVGGATTANRDRVGGEAAAQSRAFTDDELAFFDEGDELEKESAADSFSDLAEGGGKTAKAAKS